MQAKEFELREEELKKMHDTMLSAVREEGAQKSDRSIRDHEVSELQAKH